MHHINSAIEKYGARFDVAADRSRPWTVTYNARLVFRDGRIDQASSRTPPKAISSLESKLASASAK